MSQTNLEMALNGICPNCEQSMPALTQEMINNRLDDCEDDDLCCSKCEVDTLLGAGWGLDTFKECIPSYLEGGIGDYIRTQLKNS